MFTALITLISVSISVSIGLMLPVMLYLDRQRRLEIRAVEERLGQEIRAAETRLEAASKERHDQLMKKLDEWPVRDFEHRITVLEQAAT